MRTPWPITAFLSVAILLTGQSLDSVLWMQTAVEHDASYLQAYRQAHFTLDRALKDRRWTAAVEQTGKFKRLPPAIILDVDETVLDNSPAEAQDVLDDVHSFDPVRWDVWVKKMEAAALPGAAEFTRYAAARGVKVFYVTNRGTAQEDATRRNLAKWNFPRDDKLDTVYCLGEKPDWGSDKGTRRQAIAERYRVLMLFGDDLGDFLSQVRQSPQERKKLAEKYVANWGERWVILPNPAYGSWDQALYGFDNSLNPQARLKKKTEQLRGFK
ncbi:MAG: HAD family acid phosphatase [Bryobacteraceae bacterium]